MVVSISWHVAGTHASNFELNHIPCIYVCICTPALPLLPLLTLFLSVLLACSLARSLSIRSATCQHHTHTRVLSTSAARRHQSNSTQPT